MKKLLLVLMLFFSCLSTVWGQDDNHSTITEDQAIEIAKKEAISRGRCPEWFGGEVHAVLKEEGWVIRFSGKPDNGLMRPGNYFKVYLSPEGQFIFLMGGM